MAEMLLTIEHDGKIFSPPVMDEVKIEWERTGTPGKLTFTTIKVEGMEFSEGDAVCFCYDDKKVFLGYVFTKKRDKKQQIEVICYDQIRYLKNKYSYVFEKKTATQIIEAICKDYNIKTGTLDDTKYVIPTVAEENISALDISLSTLEETLTNTGKMYVLYDDFGSLTLKNAESMVSDTLILDNTAEDFEYSSSIDDETYNSVVLYYKPKSESSSSSSSSTSSGASKLLSVARKQIGVREAGSSNKVKYNTEYYGRAVSGSAYPWCCVFVWWVFKHAGLSKLFYGGGKTAACRTAMAWFKKKGRFYKKPKVGDVVFFDFTGCGVSHHVGIVEKVKSNGSVVTIEGNASNKVRRLTRKSGIMGYGRPAYSSSKKSSSSSSSSKSSKSSNKVQVFSASNADKIKEWGTLRYFEEIKSTDGAKKKAEQLLELYCRKTREFKVTGAFGDTTVRGGTLIPIILNLGDIKVSNYMLVDKVTHTFSNGHHTMDLTLEGAWSD